MINTKIKKVLTIDLDGNQAGIKSFADMNKFIGGVGLGIKLLENFKDKNPIIIAVGPLNGFFPYTSKTAVVLNKNGVVEDLYIGGGLSLRIRFAGLDAIAIYGKSKEEVILEITNSQTRFLPKETKIDILGLPGKRSVLQIENNKLNLDGYFTTPENFLEKAMEEKNISSLVITGTELFKLDNFSEYQKVYEEILSKQEELSVEKNVYPSCSNCPMGCGKSKVGELGGNILVHSLVGCQFADKIYTDIGIVFSALNVLGYDYTHEDIENLPSLIEETLRNLS